jgi:glyoxylase-like metal-dependent hydrolase (beta-lactamase superfamily II)
MFTKNSNMKIKLLICLFCLNLTLVFAQQNMDNAVISTVKIKDNIHMLQWAGAGNMMLLSGKDGNILIDDQFAPLSAKINAAIQAVNPGNVKFLFNTHYHGDHSGGNANFAKMGATIFAHNNVRARLMADSTKLKYSKLSKPEPMEAWPVITYSEGMNLYLNNEAIVIFHVDKAHTDGDALFYLPKSNIIHTGDCFMKARFPFIDRSSGGSVDGWIKVVAQVLTLVDDETIIIPGHGDLANKNDYRDVHNAVMIIKDGVKKALKERQNLNQILALNLAKDYDKTFGSGFIKGDALIKTMFEEFK